MKKIIVCTSINPMTEALKEFDKLEDWELIVVEDLKTPAESYKGMRGHYLTTQEQAWNCPELSAMLGWNTVDRRNLGYLEAYNRGADVIAMVDDDNYPLDDWGEEVVVGKQIELREYTTIDPVFDPLAPWDLEYWHRGFPISCVPNRRSYSSKTRKVRVDVQANLWNDDPDVDAVCRMMMLPYASFDKGGYYSGQSISPFNMQNTFISREVIQFCPSVPFTGRMCDIWGAYYVQAKVGARVAYGPATVRHKQHRSWESIVKDMEEEMLGYKHQGLPMDMITNGPDEALKAVLSTQSWEFVQAYQESFV
jgi:hypothetical protein